MEELHRAIIKNDVVMKDHILECHECFTKYMDIYKHTVKAGLNEYGEVTLEQLNMIDKDLVK